MEIAQNQNDPSMVALHGRFDANECDRLDAFVQRMREKGQADLKLDLSAVSFVDSSALASLVWLSKWATANNQRFEVHNPSDSVSVILEITAIDRALTIRNTSPVPQ